MASISSPGIGSGLDINALVTSIIDAERAPASNRLDFKEATFQAQLTAYGSLKGALSTFQSTLTTLSFTSAFKSASAETNNLDVLSADVSDAAADSSYSIKVNELAQAHALVTTGFTNTSDVVGTGTLTFKLGTTDYVKDDPDAIPPVVEAYNSFTLNADKPAESLIIDETNNTLQGVRDAVNGADMGVTASIIYDGSAYRLTFASKETGADNSLEVSVIDSGDGDTHTDTNGLSRLAFNSGATNLEQTLEARDASLTINGLAVTSGNNVVREAITGVTLNLKEAQLATDSAVSLDVKRSNSVVSNSVYSFVNEYNSLVDTVNDLSSFDADTSRGGILLGDSVLRGVTSQLRRELNDTIEGLGGPFQSLVDIGVSTDRDGKLSIDNERLDAAISSDPDAVAALFAVDGQTANDQVVFSGSSSATKPGDYPVNITQIATQGTYTGSAFGYGGSIVIDGSNDDLTFSIDGISTGTITLTNNTYTGASLAGELQARINGVKALKDEGVSVNVSFDEINEVFSISSTRYGDASIVNISSVEGNGYGLAAGSGIVGVNVAGTIGGQAATGSGRVLSGSVNAEGLQIEILDSNLGSHGTISFSRGIADKLNTMVDSMLSSGGSLDSRIDGLEGRIEGLGVDREQLARRMSALESRMRTQFVAMDLLVGQLQSTGNYLTQQLDNLPKIEVRSR